MKRRSNTYKFSVPSVLFLYFKSRIGFPIFQASIPGSLKNVFDLLPVNAFHDKVIGLVATAGSSKHYLIPEMHLKPILSYMK